MNKYKLKNNTYFLNPKDNPKDKIELEIGDSKQSDFLPQVKLKRWDNETNFSIRLIDNEKGNARVITDKEKIIWKKGNINIEYYEEDNAYKMVWFLKEKPISNKVEFTIQSKRLDFYYQPVYTKEEILKKQEKGNFINRDAMGSYAIYHNGNPINYVGDKEYKVGKFGHIYRPHLYDSNGLEEWGKLHIENGIYSVEIPQNFLDKAIYPIKSNDTIGYTSIGDAGAYSIVNNQLRLSNIDTTATINGSVDEVRIRIETTEAIDFKGIVVNSSLNILSNGVSGKVTSIIQSNPSFWQIIPYSIKPDIYSSSDYLPGFIANGSTGNIKYDAGSSGDSKYDNSNDYATPTNPTDATNSSAKYSIYAIYTKKTSNTTDFFQLF